MRVSSLGDRHMTDASASAQPPTATRVGRSGWRDPRLWIGVALVTVSVVAGARLLAAADDTVTVWAVVDELGAGSTVTDDDLVAVRVRFARGGDLDHYFPAADPLPADGVLVRGVGAGELLPRSAVGSADDVGLLHVPIEVEPHRVSPAVTTGSVVDVWVGDPGGGGRRDADPEAALSAVTVVEAPAVDESFAVDGTRQLVLAVPEEDVAPFQSLVGRIDAPVIDVIQRP